MIGSFLDTLYSNNYFGLYLLVAIIVLVVIFLCVLFFGKKDKKHREIEVTKKLEEINTEAFKEETNPSPVEVDANLAKEEAALNDKALEEMPVISNVEENSEISEPVLTQSEVVNPEVESVPLSNEVATPPEETEAVISEIKPSIMEEVKSVEENKEIPIPEAINVEAEVDNLASVLETPIAPKKEPVLEPAAISDFQFDSMPVEEEKEEKQVPFVASQVFSSVYAPNEKPKAKEKETNIEEEEPQNDEEDFELPKLKKETNDTEIDLPKINNYNLDEISGESYNINKK